MHELSSYMYKTSLVSQSMISMVFLQKLVDQGSYEDNSLKS